jgi:RNA polymerase sigma-70 factor (ECF subfamily)
MALPALKQPVEFLTLGSSLMRSVGQDDPKHPAERESRDSEMPASTHRPVRHDRRVLQSSGSVADEAMERYASGDDRAFAELYDALAPRLYNYLLRRTRDSFRAEDLLQQTLLQLHCMRDRFIPGAAVTPWVFAIARRLLVDSIRQKKKELSMDRAGIMAQTATTMTPDDLAHSAWMARRLASELSSLPETQRVAFVLIREQGLSVREAARILGTTVSAVKMRTHRAYEALRVVAGESGTFPVRGNHSLRAGKSAKG